MADTKQRRSWEAALDRIGRQKPENVPGNEAAFQSWVFSVWELLEESIVKLRESDPISQSLEDYHDAICEFCKYLNSFDPGKQSLSHYANAAIKKNISHMNSNRKKNPGGISGIGDNTAANPNGAKTVVVTVTGGAFQPTVDDETDIGNLFGATLLSEDPALACEGIDRVFAQITSMVLNFKELCPGKGNNVSRLRYFKMFFSEKVENMLQEHTEVVNEADVLSAMLYAYLTFYLDDDFTPAWKHTIQAIRAAKLKNTVYFNHKPIAVVRDHEEWLPYNVQRAFIETVTGKAPALSTISEFRTTFTSILERLLYVHQQEENK